MTPVTCPHCGLAFADDLDAYTHRTGPTGQRTCEDPREHTDWHVDNDGHWTHRPHQPPPLWPTYQLHEDTQEVTYWYGGRRQRGG